MILSDWIMLRLYMEERFLRIARINLGPFMNIRDRRLELRVFHGIFRITRNSRTCEGGYMKRKNKQETATSR